MRDLRNWASALATATLILLAPIIGFTLVVTAEMLTDLLAKLGPPVVWPVAGAALGWVLLRKFGGQPQTSR
jgi:positive regulator of sigma E activity